GRSRSHAAGVPRAPPGLSGRRCRASVRCVPPYMATQYSFGTYMASPRLAVRPAVARGPTIREDGERPADSPRRRAADGGGVPLHVVGVPEVSGLEHGRGRGPRPPG